MITARILRALALGALIATPVFPCGGPEHYDVSAPLVRPERHLEAISVDYDDLDWRRRSELRFLAPFLEGGKTKGAALWQLAYRDQPPPHDVAFDSSATFGVERVVDRFEHAITSRGADEMVASSKALVDTLLDTPAIVAAEFQPVAKRAVALLEAAAVATPTDLATFRSLFAADGATPADLAALPPWGRDWLETRALPRQQLAEWGRTHPRSARAPSAMWVAVGEAMRRGIPDGWATTMRDSVPSARWRELAAVHADWLARYPTHAMAQWVRLSRARLAYFQGDTTTAWDILLDLYARAPTRAVAEMRYLLQQSFSPPSLDDRRIDDELRAALLSEVAVTPSQWSNYWRRADAAGAGAWRRLTKERLLWQAAGGLSVSYDGTGLDSVPRTPLPSAFPMTPAALSPMAEAFRLLAMLRAGRDREAISQVGTLGSDSLVAPLKAHLLLAAHRWTDAIATPSLSTDSKEYLLRVVAPDSVLFAVRKGGEPKIGVLAVRAQAMRLVGRGDWRGGANLLLPSEGARRDAWLANAVRAADTTLAGTLAYARWMRQRHGALLGAPDKVWYRSVSWRLAELKGGPGYRAQFDARLPWRASDEEAGIVADLTASYEMYHAVRAYARVLERMSPTDTRRRSVVNEANAAYNWLASWDNNNSSVFRDELEREGIGGIIRRAGRRR